MRAVIASVSSAKFSLVSKALHLAKVYKLDFYFRDSKDKIVGGTRL